MNSVTEVLFLRRPRLEYVAPPVCEFDFSSTGGPVITLDALAQLTSPTGFVLGGRGRFHLSWNRYPGAICYTVYKAVDPNNPFGEYVIVAECIPDPEINLEPEGPGCYRVSAITPHGETALSEPICGVGSCPYIFSGAEPAFQSVPATDSAEFTAVVGNADAATFWHWYKDGVFYQDTTLTTQEVLQIASVALSDAGAFTLIVGNSECEDESEAAVLEVTSGGMHDPIAFWKMDGLTAEPVDEVGAYVLFDVGNAPAVPGVTGKIIDAFQLDANNNQTVAYNTNLLPELAPTGNGCEMMFWFKFNNVVSPGPNPPLVCQFIAGYFVQTDSDAASLGVSYDPLVAPGVLTVSFGAASTTIPFTPTIGLYQFMRIRYDADTGKVGISVDNAALTESVSTHFLTGTGTDGIVAFSCLASPFQRMDITVDEVAIFDLSLPQVEADDWYNGGAGRTFP
jgi:hypothetical protein